MKTSAFLRRYAYVYLYVVAFFLICAAFLRGTADQVSLTQQFAFRPLFIIDAGHGGIDSGTSSPNGVRESQINLEISRRLESLMRLLGYDTLMTRESEDSVATEGQTIRAQKQSDLRNRVALVNDQYNAVLVSIHQNFYPDSRYAGPQVFYSGNGSDRQLAQYMQTKLNQALSPNSKRTCKQSEGVYLMQHIECPGILIECGFLSNPAEEILLQTDTYQNQLCCVIAATLITYAQNGT